MSRAISKKLFSNVTKTADPIFDKGSSTLPQEETTSSFFFISDYMYGDCITFTACLLPTLNRKVVFRIAKKFERKKEKRTLALKSDIKMFHLNTWMRSKVYYQRHVSAL
jgi:hypothetical protein